MTVCKHQQAGEMYSMTNDMKVRNTYKREQWAKITTPPNSMHGFLAID